MSHLRQNIITRDWVIVASDRGHRPNDFSSEPRPRPQVNPYEATCPFCPGNESLAAAELARLPRHGPWRVRVLRNKYPALVPEGDRVRRSEGIYRTMTGVGRHEVIVEHPRHDLMTATLPLADLEMVITAYRDRYREAHQDPRIESVILFKNHGRRAGTSLLHPHSQLAATPVVPNQVRIRVEEAIRYFDDTGECVFCRTLREELKDRERIVTETDHFVGFIPYAALSPYHSWIFPRRHMSSFDAISDREIRDLARNLRQVLAKMYHGLNNPDYNYSIRSMPTRSGPTDYFHWYLTIIPRVTRTAGFELGSGMFINSASPEASAEFLRGVQVPETDSTEG